MLLFEAFIKFGAIGLLMALGLLFLRDGRSTQVFRFSLPLIVAMIFMFMTTGSPSISVTGAAAIPLRLFDLFNSIFIWWLGLALFKDDFKLGKREWLVATAYAMVAVPSRLHYLGFDVYWNYAMTMISPALTFLMMMHLCYLALVGHQEDLVERRRRVRIWFVIAVAVVVIASILAERVADYIGAYQEWTIWVTYLFTFPLAMWAMLWLTRLHPEMLAFGVNQLPALAKDTLDARDKLAFERLQEVMEAERAYTNHGLTIADLAQQVKIPPHQLRKLINQTMGHRNFSSYLNTYRIAEVKKSLAAVEKARTPVLTLAMDAGFSSLAPFNRAFKASEGITPSDFRSQSLTKNSQTTVQN